MSNADDAAAFYTVLFEDGLGHVLTTAGLKANGDWDSPRDHVYRTSLEMLNALQSATDKGRHCHVMMGSVVAAESGRTTRKEYVNADVRALAFDFDVHHNTSKERKPTDYLDGKAVMTAIANAVKAGMPKPNFLVQSGSGGIHLWYFLNKVLPAAGATALRGHVIEKMHGFNLKLDEGAASKPNVSLRAPGSTNTKPHLNRPVRTRELKSGAYSLSGFLKEWGLPRRATAVVPTAEKAKEDLPPLPEDIRYTGLKGCKYIATQLQTGGVNLTDRKHWMGVSACLRQFESQVSDLWVKNCFAKYKPPPTEEAMDAAMDPVKGMRGPHTCRGMGGGIGQNPLCDGCGIKPNERGATFPLFHMAEVAQQAATAAVAAKKAKDDAPISPEDLNHYTVDGGGNVWRGGGGGGGDREKICSPAFGISKHVRGAEFSSFLVVNLQSKQQAEFLPESLNNATKISDQLGRINVRVHSKEGTKKLYQKLTDAVKSTIHTREVIGWMDDGISFAAPTVLVHEDMLTPSAMLTPPLNGKDLGCTGDYREWYRAMKPILELKHERSELYLFGLLLGFSSIIPAFLGQTERTAVVSFFNPESGTGKTTLLKLGNSWFMKYCETSIGFDDTDANTMRSIGSMHHLYSNIDEITTKIKAEPVAISKMVRQMITGVERGRLTSEGGQQFRGDWQNQIAVSTNESLFEITADPGLSARIMEFSVSNEDKPLPLKVFNALERTVQDHYGCAGVHVVQSMLKGGEGTRELLSDHYHTERGLINNEAAFDPKDGANRFRVILMATVMTAARTINELGHAQVPLDKFRTWCVEQLHRSAQRQANVSLSSQYTFDEFYNDILREGCVRKGSSGAEISGQIMAARAPFYCFKEDEKLYIRRDDIHEYLTRRGRSKGALDLWIKAGVLGNHEVDMTFKQGDVVTALTSYLVVDYERITTFSEGQHDVADV